ncbi:MAG: Gfo/Idh/MocA family oxidoreductase [Bacteroidales bacterium]|nr:Gfo/Idh/MocA family oxidoreductase [Bacteroidales bacterium]
MNTTDFHVGIIGAGHIAEKAVATLKAIPEMDCLAIASRSQEKADGFASKFGIPRSYGSYDALLDDPDIDLVYIATVHSTHFQVAKAAVEKGKPCLVEKSFMMNADEAKALLGLAKERGVFVAEAIWTRYQPARDIMQSLIEEFGKPSFISATLSYNIAGKERLLRPELGGGALLDLGVYGLNFVRMADPSPVAEMSSSCIKFPSGTDKSETISLILEDGTMACVQASACCEGDNTGVLACGEVSIVADNLNNPQLFRVYRRDHKLVREVRVPEQINGYEYEFLECKKCIREALLQSPRMPHMESIYVMELMDRLRREWKVTF